MQINKQNKTPSTCKPYNPTMILGGMDPREMKIDIHRKTCTCIFITALLIIALTWKPPICPSISETYMPENTTQQQHGMNY